MSTVRHTTRLTTAAAVVALASLTGCQETVVRESVRPSTGIIGSPSYVRTHDTAAAPARPKQPGLIEGVGDFMFGWVDDVFKPEPEAAPSQPSSNPRYDPIWVRMGND